jgi:hypothetical protein
MLRHKESEERRKKKKAKEMRSQYRRLRQTEDERQRLKKGELETCVGENTRTPVTRPETAVRKLASDTLTHSHHWHAAFPHPASFIPFHPLSFSV